MEQKINSKTFIFYLLFLFIGICFGFIAGSYQKPNHESEVAEINYDSICVRTLKEYYLSQNPKERKKLVDQAAKQLAIDKMTNN